jgi:hypothetical protein
MVKVEMSGRTMYKKVMLTKLQGKPETIILKARLERDALFLCHTPLLNQKKSKYAS